MNEPIFDPALLVSANYVISDPLETARLQSTVIQFMDLVRTGSIRVPESRELINEFCQFVDDIIVWRHAQMVVPEFRFALEDQVMFVYEPVTMIIQMLIWHFRETIQEQQSAPLRAILQNLSSLPLPRRTSNTITTEGDMLRRRQQSFIEYIMTEGQGKGAVTSDLQQLAEQASRDMVDKTLDLRDKAKKAKKAETADS